MTARTRLVYAAAHVVMRETYAAIDHAPDRPGDAEAIAEYVDWERTMAFRRHLDAQGFGIAEAMDTAQRFELGWTGAKRLIEGTGALGLAHGFVAGASSDHTNVGTSRRALIDGVIEQVHVIQRAGGIAMLLPMPMLAQQRATEDEYVGTYTAIIDACTGPLFVHWLGAMFLPVFEGYFPGDSFDRIMAHDPETVRGAKLSLLDADREIALRRTLLERNQIMLTGDDFNFAGLIEGNNRPRGTTNVGTLEVPLGDFSHGLLGIFDGIAEPAGRALRALEVGDLETYRAIMTPLEALSRTVFEAPTQHYKCGLAFLSWLNGHQENRMLVNHVERERDADHYHRLAQLAADAGALTDPDRARRLLTS